MNTPARMFWLGSALLMVGACTDPVIETQTLTPADPPRVSAAPVSAPNTVSSPFPSLGSGFLSGVVSDAASQRLLPGVTVRLGDKQVQSDQAGYYQFEQIEAGEAKLIVEAPGYLPQAITVEIQARRQVRDLSLQLASGGLPPLPTAGPTPAPLTSPTPILLLPGGATPSPAISASVIPLPSVSAVATPTPVPTPSPLYDPVLDDAKLSEVFLKRKINGLELNFLLYKSNGLPVDWKWGVVQVEYYLAQSVSSNGVSAPGNLISSGRTIIAQSNEPFLLTLNAEQLTLLGEKIYVNYTLTLPDKRQLALQKEFVIN
ncbi:MAG: carboxypeptidase regulatory-like domain-containing protein [Candidatus Sericytochromatia bacterium]